MKKILAQISLICLIMAIGIVAVLIPSVYAADPTISVSNNVKKGESYTVTVNIPSNAVGYQGRIKVVYSDGTSDTTSLLAKFGFEDSALVHPGNMVATFTAKAAGTATVSVIECEILDADKKALKNPSQITFTIASNEPEKPTTPSTPSTPETPSTPSTPSTPEKPSTGGNTGNSGNNDNTGNSGSTTTKDPKFTDVNETVYTTERCNIRSSYSTESTILNTVEKGTKLTRTAIGDNGWSRISYEGKTAYVSSQYLTKTAPEEEEPEEEKVVFKDTHENLYAKQSCNLRASWSTESEKVGYLTKGQAVERTGYADNGWSRIIYEGKTVYVASRLLSVEKPEEEIEEEEEPTNEVDTNTVVDDPTQMSEEDRLKELQDEVGVLPEVGNNIAKTMYICITVVALIGAAIGIYFIKK